MKALYYNGEKICTDDDYNYAELEDALDEKFESIVNDFAENRYTPSELIDFRREELENELWEALFDGSYSPDPDLEVREVEDDDDDVDAPKDACKACENCCTATNDKVRIIVPGAGTVLEFDKEKGKKHMTGGCPICDGKLNVIGSYTLRHRMPNLYASICELCGAQIVIGDDEEQFFPVVDEEAEN